MNSTVMPSGIAGVDHEAALVGPGVDDDGIAQRLGARIPRRRDGFVDVVHVEGDVREAGVARARLDPAAVGRAAILDQLQAMAGRLQVGDLDIRAVDAHHLLDEPGIARRAVQQREAQGVLEQADRAVQAGDGEAGVIGRRDRETRHRRSPSPVAAPARGPSLSHGGAPLPIVDSGATE